MVLESRQEVAWLTVFAGPPEERPEAGTPEQRSRLISAGWQLYQEAASQEPVCEAAIRIHLLQALLALARG